MLSRIILLSLSLLSFSSYSQESFLSGTLNIPDGWSRQVYLSVKKNYRNTGKIDASDIIARTIADSLGEFFFPRSAFTNNEQIYELHLSESEDEIEVFISDFQVGAIGQNFLVFIATNQSTITIQRSGEGRLFGPIMSKSASANTWQKLNKVKRDYYAMAFDQGEVAKEYYLSNYHNELVAVVHDRSVLSKYQACQFLLMEDANLSTSYLKSIESHFQFFDDLNSDSSEDYSEHLIQLSKEVDLIKLQLNGKQSLKESEYKIELLQYIIIALSLIVIILATLYFRLRRNAKSELSPTLTEQEQKIKSLIINGFSNKEIAQDLFISPSTVKSHINTLYKKEGIHSRTELLQRQK